MSEALSRLRALSFFTEIPDGLSASFLDWLLLEDSMTKRFEQHCAKVTVEIIREAFVIADEQLPEAGLLPPAQRYWLREIVLCGDGVPWLVGRTVVPESTLAGPELALQRLGNTPLGRYLFSASTLTRDFIQIGRSAELWGRRSRLRLSDKPLLLTELFLPASPLYEEEK
ncbi:chorismate lyase [Dryocola sp. LX212]|jgi:chorismate--pyruvate lyase